MLKPCALSFSPTNLVTKFSGAKTPPIKATWKSEPPSHSRLAVDKALALADSPSCVHVLHVLPSFVPLAPEGFPLESIDDSVRLDSAQKSLEEDFADQRYAGVAREVLIGDPGTVCADRAETLDAELLVVPSHGRSGVSRLLLGSVAERIIRLSKRPVLVLKIPHD